MSMAVFRLRLISALYREGHSRHYALGINSEYEARTLHTLGDSWGHVLVGSRFSGSRFVIPNPMELIPFIWFAGAFRCRNYRYDTLLEPEAIAQRQIVAIF
jgi:hypothetical protein